MSHHITTTGTNRQKKPRISELTFGKSFLLIIALFFCATGSRGQQETSASEKIFSPSELLADMDSLYIWINATHPDLYSQIPKKKADKAWVVARKKINKPMSQPEFARLLSPLLNQYDDGHLNLYAYFWEDEEFKAYAAKGGKFFPLPVKVKNDKLYVLANAPSGDIKAGAEIKKINGHRSSDVIKKLMGQIPGDSYAHREATVSRLFNTTLWYLYGWGEDIEIKYTNFNEKEQQKTILPGLAFEEVLKYNFPKGNKKMGLLLFEEEGLAVLETFGFQGSKKTRQFLDSAFTVIHNKNIQTIAVDVRKNGGGSSSVGDAILQYLTTTPYVQTIRQEKLRSNYLLSKPYNKWLKEMFDAPEHQDSFVNNRLILEAEPQQHAPLQNPELFFSGSFYLLTSPQTYSSAHMLAAAVKGYVLGKIIGEETGSRMKFFGEPAIFELPNTKIWGQCPTVMHFLPGYSEEDKDSAIHPDVYIETTRKHISENRDPVLEYLKRTAKEKRSRAGS